MGGGKFGRIVKGVATGGMSEVSRAAGVPGFDPISVTKAVKDQVIPKRPKAAGTEAAPDPLQLEKSPNSHLAGALKKRLRGSGKGTQKGLTMFSGGNIKDDVFNLGSKSLVGG